jgi:hypothetical protein
VRHVALQETALRVLNIPGVNEPIFVHATENSVGIKSDYGEVAQIVAKVLAMVIWICRDLQREICRAVWDGDRWLRTVSGDHDISNRQAMD